MGIMPQYFFPEKAVRDFALTPYLEKLAAHRDQMTVFSGVSHPSVTGGHAAEKCFLTATPHPERGGFRNWISLDQLVAEQVGGFTRYPSLTLAASGEPQSTLSYTRSGAPIPAERSPSKLFERLFVQGKPEDVDAKVEELRQGRSTLDFVGEQLARLNRSLSKADQQRMDQYATAVRELEERLQSSEAWEFKPKPTVNIQPPKDIDDGREFVARTKLMLDMMKLAIETDSSRVITLFIDTTIIHNITHHGYRDDVLAELRGHEERQFGCSAISSRRSPTAKRKANRCSTARWCFTAPAWAAPTRTPTTTCPCCSPAAGSSMASIWRSTKRTITRCRICIVSMLQRLGMEVDAFATSTGTMRGLELA